MTGWRTRLRRYADGSEDVVACVTLVDGSALDPEGLKTFARQRLTRYKVPRDFYHFDPLRKTLAGERTGREFRLGDRLDVRVLKASLEERKIDFGLVEEERGAKPPPPRGTPAKRVKKPYG